MATIVLAGNWLPLLFPLLIIGIVLVLPGYLYPFLQRQKLNRENKLVNKLTNKTEDTSPRRH